MPAKYNSASDNLSISLQPSEGFTTSSAFMEKCNDQLTTPIITSSVKADSFNLSQSTAVFVQTSTSDFNQLFTSSTTLPVMNSLVSTSHIEPSVVHKTSTTAIIESSSDSETSISSTSPENFNYTSTQLCPQSTVMPAPSVPSPNTSSANRWRCNAGNVTDDNNREYIFPNIEMEDLRFSLWQDTLQGVSYLYHVNSSEIGCSGAVTEIRFCYRVSLNVSTEEHIFTVSIMNNSRHVLKSIDINSSGNSTTKNCMNVCNMTYCCDSMNLTDDNVKFPTSEFILGIETSNSSQVRLQNFKPNVSHGIYSLFMLNNILEINNSSMGKVATTLSVIRFIIARKSENIFENT